MIKSINLFRHLLSTHRKICTTCMHYVTQRSVFLRFKALPVVTAPSPFQITASSRRLSHLIHRSEYGAGGTYVFELLNLHHLLMTTTTNEGAGRGVREVLTIMP